MPKRKLNSKKVIEDDEISKSIEQFIDKLAQYSDQHDLSKPIPSTPIDPKVEQQKALEKVFVEQKKKEYHRDMNILDSLVAEYLKSYIILGYDLNGNKVGIQHAKSSQESDALVEHLRTTFLNIIQNN
jgi:hypothetical protein